MTGNQLKAARALAGIEQTALAEAAGVSVNTIRNMEAAAAETVKTRLDTLNKVREALETAGVIFIPENGGGAGVRLKDRQ